MCFVLLINDTGKQFTLTNKPIESEPIWHMADMKNYQND